jgi:hypothetical protein
VVLVPGLRAVEVGDRELEVVDAETYLLIRRTTAWDVDAYREWLVTTWRRLAGI